MVKHILTQLWNKRRANTWIFLELILVAFFMWGVIDPVYVLLSNRAIEPGYCIDNVFRLTMGQYAPAHRKFKEEFDTDSVRKVDFLRIYEQVRNYPGVESAVVTVNEQYPLSSSSSYSGIKFDTLGTSSLNISFYQDGDFFEVFRIRDIYTGTIPDHHNPTMKTMYLTKGVEKKFLPDGRVTGRAVYQGNSKDTTYYMVKGVMPDFKFRSTEQPVRTIFIPLEDFDTDEFPWSAQICFRIRDGLSKDVFAEQFKQELAPRISIGNLHFLKLTDFDTIYKNSEFEQGVTNKLRLQTSLTIFFLICTFLGIAGTFWLRSDARKGEIGLRMALGSTRNNILKEFLIESWLITTAAWAMGILFVLQRVYLTGFAEQAQYKNDAYLQNLFIPHFLIVSIIVYALMLLTTIMGTWLPARQASRIRPATALHEE